MAVSSFVSAFLTTCITCFKFNNLLCKLLHQHCSHTVLICEIDFQDLEKVLNLSKMYIEY